VFVKAYYTIVVVTSTSYKVLIVLVVKHCRAAKKYIKSLHKVCS
jgi:hypothetical protein